MSFATSRTPRLVYNRLFASSIHFSGYAPIQRNLAPRLFPKAFSHSSHFAYSQSRSRLVPLAVGLVGAAWIPFFSNRLLCEGNTLESFNEEAKVTIEVPVEHKPHSKRVLVNVQDLSFGTLMGLCAGYFAKKTGRFLAIVVGALFVFLQVLAYEGFVHIDWARISSLYSKKFDVDRDGKVTKADIKSWMSWFIGLLTTNFQMKSSFILGFYLGLRVR